MSENRWWIYLDEEVKGPYTVDELGEISGFTSETQVCPEGTEDWRKANEESDLEELFTPNKKDAESLRNDRSDDVEKTPEQTQGADDELGLKKEPSYTDESQVIEDDTTETEESERSLSLDKESSDSTDDRSKRETKTSADHSKSQSEEQWFIKRKGDTRGPFNFDELTALSALSPSTQVKRSVDENWRKAKSIPELEDFLPDEELEDTIKERNPWMVVLLPLLTCGLYFYYWFPATSSDLRKITNQGPNPWLFFLLLVSPMFLPLLVFTPLPITPSTLNGLGIIIGLLTIWCFYRYCVAVSRFTKFGTLILILILFLVPVFMYIVQKEINQKA